MDVQVAFAFKPPVDCQLIALTPEGRVVMVLRAGDEPDMPKAVLSATLELCSRFDRNLGELDRAYEARLATSGSDRIRFVELKDVRQ